MNNSPSSQRKDPSPPANNASVDADSPSVTADEEGGIIVDSPTPTSDDSQSDLQEDYAPGDVIECKTNVGDTTSGEVISYDKGAKVLVLNSAIGSGKTQMQFINMEYVTSTHKIRPAPQNFLSATVPNDSHEESQHRLQLAEKNKAKDWMGDAPEEAVQTFLDLRKMYNDVRWDNEDRCIRLLRHVVIREPFDAHSVQSEGVHSPSNEAVMHVKKLLINYQSLGTNAGRNTSYSPPTSDADADGDQKSPREGTPPTPRATSVPATTTEAE